MTTTATGTKTAPIVCRPWCEDGDGHSNEMGVEDQVCQSEFARVTLTLRPMWEGSGGGWYPSMLEVYAEAGPTHPPAVHLYEQSDDADLVLTPAEARRIAADLIAAAEMAETL